MIETPIFGHKYNILSITSLTKETLPKTRLALLMPEAHGACKGCGTEATHVVVYTRESENHEHTHANIFSGRTMLTIDHILPRALGGRDAITNLQIMCFPCNKNKDMIISAQELELIMKNPTNYLRPGFTGQHMKYAVNKYPEMKPFYELCGYDDTLEPVVYQAPPRPEKKQYYKESKVSIMSGGLVNTKHPHHPMWGWVHILEKFPELKERVTFA